MASSVPPPQWPTALLFRGPEIHQDETRFDRLPPELIIKIVEYLGPADLTQFASSSSRIEVIIASRSKLLEKIRMELRFIRAVRTSRVTRNLRRCNATFDFLPFDQDSRLSYLLHHADRIPCGRPLQGNKDLIVVIAASYSQAHSFHVALTANNFKVFFYNDFISRDAWEYLRNQTEKTFLIVTKIHEYFELSSMAAVINFRPLQDSHDYFEAHSLEPRRVLQVLNPDPQGFEVWRSIFQRLKPLSAPHPSFATDSPLEIDRQFYRARTRMRGGVVRPIFE